MRRSRRSTSWRRISPTRGLCLPDPWRLGPFHLVVDTANGATTTVAPRLFKELGFEVELLGNEPDGRNINLECGSTHPGPLAQRVRESKARMGIAFDGDGDRAIFVDGNGAIVDGDAVLLMCSRRMQATGRLAGNAVAATVMSNIGLEIAFRESGIEMIRCPVGDKYVMEEMLRRKLSIGGEQSGHVIFSDHLFTGDGIATALNVMRVMAETGRELADLASELVTYPQVLLNVRVQQKKDLHEVPEIRAAMERVEERLAGQGRLLVRYSGTEPLLQGDARRERSGRDPRVGLGDRRRGEGTAGMTPSRTPRLSVNVNKVATIRNSRGGSVPGVVEAAAACLAAGAPGITVHPRADARHITTQDVRDLAAALAPLRGSVEYNIEGDPRAGPARPDPAR